jgi:Cft2 family RNA processing exonuclease
MTASFTALYGSHSSSLPPCQLLELPGCSILLDCGWDSDFNPTLLEPLRHIAKSISLVLITHADIEHMGALPYVRKHFGLKAPIYATSPVVKLGNLCLYDTVLSSTAPYSLDDVDAVMALIQEVKYGQPKEIQIATTTSTTEDATITTTTTNSKDKIEVRCHASGRTLGGAVWRISQESQSLNLLYASDVLHRGERFLDGIDFKHIGKSPTLLIQDALGVSLIGFQQQLLPKIRDAQMLERILTTLRAGGDVLIPVDSTARVLEVLLLLDEKWQKEMLEKSYDVVFYTQISSIFDIASSHVEWCSKQLQNQLDTAHTMAANNHHHHHGGGGGGHHQDITRDPFRVVKIVIVDTYDKVFFSHRPRVVVCSGVDLSRKTPAREIFLSRIAHNPSSCVLFVLPSLIPHSVSSQLLRGNRIVTIDEEQQVELEGEERLKWETETRAKIEERERVRVADLEMENFEKGEGGGSGEVESSSSSSVQGIGISSILSNHTISTQTPTTTTTITTTDHHNKMDEVSMLDDIPHIPGQGVNVTSPVKMSSNNKMMRLDSTTTITTTVATIPDPLLSSSSARLLRLGSTSVGQQPATTLSIPTDDILGMTHLYQPTFAFPKENMKWDDYGGFINIEELMDDEAKALAAAAAATTSLESTSKSNNNNNNNDEENKMKNLSEEQTAEAQALLQRIKGKEQQLNQQILNNKSNMTNLYDELDDNINNNFPSTSTPTNNTTTNLPELLLDLSKPPTKTVPITIQMEIFCSIFFLDYSGRAGAQDLFEIVDQIKPKKLIVVRAGQEESERFARECYEKTACVVGLAPSPGESIDIAAHSSVVRVRVPEETIAALPDVVRVGDMMLQRVRAKITLRSTAATQQKITDLQKKRKKIAIAAGGELASIVPLEAGTRLVGDGECWWISKAEPNLDNIMKKLREKGIKCHLGERVLLCGEYGDVVLWKPPGDGRIMVSGPLCDTYFIVRKFVYDFFGLV